MRGRRPSSSRELVDVLADARELLVVGVRAAVHAGDRADHRAVPAEHLLHRVGDLADRRPGARRLDRELRAGCRRSPRRSVSASSAARTRSRVALGLHACEPFELRAPHFGVVDVARVDRRFVGELVLVDADDHLVAAVDARLAAGRGFFDAQLRHPRLDGLGHAAERLDLLDQRPRLVREALRQRLDVVRAAERVDHVRDAGLLGEDQLRVARDARREVGRQRDRLVEAVGVQALRAAEHRRQRLVRGAHDVVVRVLLGERHARRLAVRAQHLRARLLRAEVVHDARPEQPRRRAASRPP